MSSSTTLSISHLTPSTSISSLEFKLNFASVSQRSSRPTPTVESRAKPLAASSSSSSSCNNDGSGQNLFYATSRRKGLTFIASVPFVLPLHEFVDNFGAKAAVPALSDYVVVKEEIRKVVSKGKAAGVLRLVFHDAGTFEKGDNSGGMNGSIRYELERPENAGLKKSLKILEKAKKEVDAIQPVSWADMIALGGAEAVSVCGGPTIPVPFGRLDSLEPDPEGKLPEESLDASGLKQCFQRKGFSTQELVALSGAHTLGGKGFGNPTVFDNSYFKILLEKPWKSSAGMASMIGLPSDHAIVEDDECLRWITKYADNQSTFFEDFKNAYIKLVNSGARWKQL